MLVPVDWLKEYINTDLSPADLASKITMGGVEVEEVVKCGDNAILNLAPTPNRGDCLSILGVAREVAALTAGSAVPPKLDPIEGSGKMSDWVEIVVNDTEGCPRYTSRVVDGVKIGPSPEWLKQRVESVGLRSINNVVDATNYVLMELGQPVHAFDLRYLKGAKLIIDHPKSECKLIALDGKEYTFGPEDVLNLDSERAIGAAGIMGGENSGVADDTTTLVLESAYFDPKRVRRTSSRTGLVSESSRRFEKGVDPEYVIAGLHRLTELIVKVAGGKPSSDWIDVYPREIKRSVIELSLHEVNWLLGTDLNKKTVSNILKLIGCEIKGEENDLLTVTVPSGRPDLIRPVDLIEEVARIYGYDKIKDSMPIIKISSLVKPAGKDAVNEAKEVLTGLGFFEAMTYGFASGEQERVFGAAKDPIKLANPLTVEMEYMRTSIIPALIDSLIHNLNRQTKDVRLFEINKVFLPSGKDLPCERLNLAGVMTGSAHPGLWDSTGKNCDLFDAKAAVWAVFNKLGLQFPEVRQSNGKTFLHPADSFEMVFNNEIVGYCGRLHPEIEKKHDFTLPVYIFEVDFDSLKYAFLHKKIVYKPISRFPTVTRDVALLVNSSVTHKEMLQSFNKNVNNMVQGVELFDIYSGKGIPEGKKSMAYRLIFGAFDRTLSDDEVDTTFSAIIEKIKKETGAEVR